MLTPLLLIGAALAADSVDPDAGKPTFYAGSYGRVQASSDLEGGRGDATNVARHGPRLEQGPYMELDLGWKAEMDSGATVNVLITPALATDLFHYDGQFAEDLALRNFFASASNFVDAPLTVWAGSRMYRGDDIYLLDFWPMDNLNTYGGGMSWNPENTEVALHVGLNRLRGEDYQLQSTTVQTPGSVFGEEVLLLDRQRTIASLRAFRLIPVGSLTLRAKVYGELHNLPAGQRQTDNAFDAPTYEALPADQGSLVGVQASLWGWAPQSFVHLWLRRSTGLAAYGELTIPTKGLANDYTAKSAEAWMAAVTGNTETERLGLMFASYLTAYHDADGQQRDFDDRTEWVAVVRPQVYLSQHVALGAEVSHQYVRPNGVNPRTGTWDTPRVTKLSLIPAVQADKGSYTRPRIHAVYTLSLLDDAALAFFSPADVRVSGNTQHFVGLGAEWWINSQRVITPQ